MPTLNYKIEKKNFELVGDQLGFIIAAEFEAQVIEHYNTDCEGVNIYRERSYPIDASDLPMINILFADDEFENKHQGSVDGNVTFYIDISTQAKNTADGDGDVLAKLKLQRLLGIVWEILENPIHKTLDIAAPFISNCMVKSIDVTELKNNEEDLQNVQVGRITFECRINERTGLLPGNELLTHITQIKLELTDKGYKYEYGISGPNPDPDPRFVKIVNQFGEVKALLEPPATYTVEDLQAIIDTITANETTIIDPLE